MAYSDYGAFVYKNGERREDKEDVAVFATDEETFGMPSENIQSGARIFMSLIKAQTDGRQRQWYEHIHHGVLGDGHVRVACYKVGLPSIYILNDDGSVEKIKYCDSSIHEYDYGEVRFSYSGYRFVFTSGYDIDSPYEARMIEPDGTEWKCEYNYHYGVGFEDDDDVEGGCLFWNSL